MTEGRKICVTGHRPNKLWGYDLKRTEWSRLKERFKKMLKNDGCCEAITGMALGVDQVFALAVLELREEGFPICLHCVLPCQNQQERWAETDQKRYLEILAQADSVQVISPQYTATCMQERNQCMVDRADLLYAVWDGSKSGTGNCVMYARSQQKPIMQLLPDVCL